MSTDREPTPPAATNSDDAHAVPRHTTPAWESELLLSIGLVVALLQLPAVLDARFDVASARASMAWLRPLVYAYLYAKVAVYGLIATFIVHLLARGFWVALLGLRSIFPGGVRWEGLDRTGPIGLELARRGNVPLPSLIERVDNFASGTFAFGFIVLASAVMVGVYTVVVVGIASLLSQALFDGRNVWRILLALTAFTVVPLVLGAWADRRYGSRLDPGGRMARLLRRLVAAGRALSPGISREMALVFNSNVGQRRAGWLLAASLYLLFGVIAAEWMSRRGEFEFFGAGLIPRDGALVQERAHYANQRDADLRTSLAPFVQADVVRDPYLRLFVPLSPRRLPDAMRAACPDVSPAANADPARESSRRQAALACLERLLEPRLDGAPMPAGTFEFADDPDSVLRGIVGHIPLADVAEGRHEVTIRRLPAPDEDAKPEDPQRVAFWR